MAPRRGLRTTRPLAVALVLLMLAGSGLAGATRTPVGAPPHPGAPSASDGNPWRNLTVPAAAAPPAGGDLGLATDPYTGVTVAFGGIVGTTASNAVWEFAGGNWTDVGANETVRPPALAVDAFLWDDWDQYFLLYGCPTTFPPAPCETWSFLDGNWTDLAPATNPGLRLGSAASLDPSQQEVVLFGGAGLAGPLNDTWTYADGNWTNVTSSVGPAPAARAGAGFTYDADRSGVVLFGGRDSSTNASFNDTWLFSVSGWVLLDSGASAAPSGRAGAAFAYDPELGRELLFGGVDAANAVLDDTWEYGPEGWTNLTGRTLAGTPPPSFGAGTAYVGGTLGILVVNGCEDASCASPEAATWSYHWTVTGGLGASSILIPPGGSVSLQTSVFTPPGFTYHYAYAGLPTGCASIDASVVNCTAALVGRFATSVVVSTPDVPGLVVTFVGPILVVDTTPSVTLNASPTATEVQVAVTFLATAQGGLAPYDYNWTGLPSGCLGQNASLLTCRPPASGNLSVTVTITDALGLTAVASLPSYVVAPRLGVTASASHPGCSGPFSVAFVSVVTGGEGPYTYLWTYSDGASSNASDPTHTFAASPTGRSSLRVTDAFGVTAQANVTVVPSCATGGASSTSFPVGWLAVAALVAIGAGGVAAVLLVRRRRPPS